jgi:hypothetical protein
MVGAGGMLGEMVGCSPDAVVGPPQAASITASAQMPGRFTTQRTLAAAC